MSQSPSETRELLWTVGPRTIDRVLRHSRVVRALADVRGDVALLAGLDPRWRRVADLLRAEPSDEAALAELLRAPLGASVLREVRRLVEADVCSTGASVAARVSRSAEPSIPVAVPVRAARTPRKSRVGRAVLAVLVLGLVSWLGIAAVALAVRVLSERGGEATTHVRGAEAPSWIAAR